MVSVVNHSTHTLTDNLGGLCWARRSCRFGKSSQRLRPGSCVVVHVCLLLSWIRNTSTVTRCVELRYRFSARANVACLIDKTARAGIIDSFVRGHRRWMGRRRRGRGGCHSGGFTADIPGTVLLFLPAPLSHLSTHLFPLCHGHVDAWRGLGMLCEGTA